MIRYLVLAQSDCTAAALKAWLELAGKRRAADADHTTHVVGASQDALAIFYEAREFLASALGEARRLVVLIDALNLNGLNPCQKGGWDTAVGMLILAFPEARWVIGVISPGSAGNHKTVQQLHGLASLLEEPFDPLFDASGLRQLVREQTKVDGEKLLTFANRDALAYALDDETAYARFHAYTAYRFGYRSLPVETEKLAKAALGNGGEANGWPAPTMVFEDFFLNYPDRNTRAHWSDLSARTDNEELPRLEFKDARPMRVFISTGQEYGTSAARREHTRAELRRLRREGRLGTLVPKPVAGIYDLWRASGLRRKLHAKDGYAPGFDWPPRREKEDRIRRADVVGGHSAPGTLLLVASTLLERATALMEVAKSVGETVRGAVLATDALELLADKTPMTALEALALKHRFEVMAECQFYGVQSHFDVRERIGEIQKELHAIGRFFHRRNQRLARWNAEAMVLGDLVAIFDEHEQFDESMIMQARARGVHRRLWFKRYMRAFGDELRWLNPLYWLATYTHGLLRSLPTFFCWLSLWILGLGTLFATVEPKTPLNRWSMGFQDAVSSFFSVGGPLREEPLDKKDNKKDNKKAEEQSQNEGTPPQDSIAEQVAKIHGWTEKPTYEESHPFAWVVCLSIVAGFFHLGIFISHLYKIASRK